MAMDGSSYCFFHDPATETARKAAQRQGGKANGPAILPADTADVPLHSGKDVVGVSRGDHESGEKRAGLTQGREHPGLSL